MENHTLKPVVASLMWDSSSQIHELQSETIEGLGYPHYILPYDAPIPENVHIIVVTGPYGSLRPLVDQIRKCPPQTRPVLAYWFEESLDMRLPEFIRRLLASGFSELNRYDKLSGLTGLRSMEFLNSRGRRLSFLGDILWLHRNDLLDVLAVCSTVYANYLSQFGVPCILVPRGFHPRYGDLLNLERDIALTWLGKMRTKRRERAVSWVRRQVERLGYQVRIHDGVENDFIYGSARTELLNRTWFALNVHFSGPSDELSLRHCVAAPNGAVILTEPSANQYPFVPGKHLVESSIEEMPEKLDYYIRNPDEWKTISREMHHLMKTELTLDRSVRTILREAENILHHRALMAGRRLGSALGRYHLLTGKHLRRERVLELP